MKPYWVNPPYGMLDGSQKTEQGGVLRYRQPEGAANRAPIHLNHGTRGVLDIYPHPMTLPKTSAISHSRERPTPAAYSWSLNLVSNDEIPNPFERVFSRKADTDRRIGLSTVALLVK